MIRPKQFENDRERVMWNLSHHAPGQEGIQAITELRSAARGFADVVLLECPRSRELSMALTSLEDALQYAVASIARADEVAG